MAKTLHIPNEPRFVRAIAVAVDPGDTLSLLMEIGALGSSDSPALLRTSIGLVRRTREALVAAYDRASDLKDWDQAHTISVLREALAQSDPVAYLAYAVQGMQWTTPPASAASAVSGSTELTQVSAEPYAEALAVIGCAADTLGTRRRPWEIEPHDLSLPEWRERVWKLLFALPGNALPMPAEPHPPPEGPCTCCESDSPRALDGEHADWCPAGKAETERGDER